MEPWFGSAVVFTRGALNAPQIIQNKYRELLCIFCSHTFHQSQKYTSITLVLSRLPKLIK